jgi:acyl-CoA thioesterase YciA
LIGKIKKGNNMELITTKICMTKDIGANGNLFGGNMLALLDESGAAFASQVIHNPRVVTVKMSEVIFKKPVKVGNLIKVYGEVEDMGTTSVTIKLETRSYNVYTKVEQVVCDTEIKFVRIDEEGMPIPISDKVRERYAELLNKK